MRFADFVEPFIAAARVAVVVEPTPRVLTTKVAVEFPAPTVTVCGTIAEALFELSVTIAPLAGAGATSVTVPVADLPPITEVGDTVRPDTRLGGFIVSVAVWELLPEVAVIVAVETAAT